MLAHTHTHHTHHANGLFFPGISFTIEKCDCAQNVWQNRGDKIVICHTSANIFIHMAAAQMAVKTDFPLNATNFYTFYQQEPKKRFELLRTKYKIRHHKKER